MSTAYDPTAQVEIKVWDVECRRDPARTLMARVYQPQGDGPFPVLLDVHGGAWNAQDRTANAPVDERLAASGMLVVAIDVRLAQEAPYPASVADLNYGIRWLKSKAPEWRGDPATLGVLGSSSGGHITQLTAMRPRDPRYTAHPLPEASDIDAAIAYVVTRSPISDPVARYKQAQKMQRQMEQVQEKLAAKEISVSSGGGAVVVKANGQGQFLSLHLDPEFLKEDAAFVSETILGAVKEAAAKAKQVNEDEMRSVTAGMNLPGMM